MNSPRILAAARALCEAYSKDSGTDMEAAWEAHKSIWMQDATIAIEAADYALGERSAKSMRNEITRHKANITELVMRNKQLEDTMVEYRKRYGVMGVAA